VEILKSFRLEMGLSQQALAEKFNLTQQFIYKYANGLAEPDIKSLKNFAIFFGISVDCQFNASPSPEAKDMLSTLAPTEREIYEIDFLLAWKNKICPLELKSSGYRTHASLDARFTRDRPAYP
jgi:transcriptional regulator with XRE-family HTH domain